MNSKKILLIEDEELVMRSTEKLLKKQGYEVMSCKNGEDALGKIEGADIDLVITDIRMPGMNGVEVIKKIREYRKLRGLLPVKEIIVTGYAEEDVNKEAEQLAVENYIYKPFDLRDFLVVVQKAVER